MVVEPPDNDSAGLNDWFDPINCTGAALFVAEVPGNSLSFARCP